MGCTGSSESTRVKMPHCRKSHVAAHMLGAQKKHLIETVLLSTHNMFWLGDKMNTLQLHIHVYI